MFDKAFSKKEMKKHEQQARHDDDNVKGDEGRGMPRIMERQGGSTACEGGVMRSCRQAWDELGTYKTLKTEGTIARTPFFHS